MDLPGHKPVLAPGMSQVIEAGSYYTLKDDNNDEVELVGKLDQPTIDFLKAFDVYATLKARIGDTADPTRAAWLGLIQAWNKLGSHAREVIR